MEYRGFNIEVVANSDEDSYPYIVTAIKGIETIEKRGHDKEKLIAIIKSTIDFTSNVDEYMEISHPIR
ncbi:hypothetical protein IAI10_02500 [Clostridium sp. 19966]|uniref:hypothetical protein n=1 Tax=Clostridium sp. 19966 TaxID=2768166 RepID=UPI0028DD92BB|nr:hypothetical protein [Clostridium sp. 19966]MDT8715529.1 hypothetical protein [Clostridium sp. 19966]